MEPLYPHHGEPYNKAMEEAKAEYDEWNENTVGKTLRIGYSHISIEEMEDVLDGE